MADFYNQMANPASLTDEKQKQMGQPTGDDMGQGHKDFVKKIKNMLDSGEIDVANPESLLNKDVYDGLDAEWKTKTDLALANIANLLRHIDAFYRSKETPDAAPQLEQMIEQLWQMKERIKQHGDVFKF